MQSQSTGALRCALWITASERTSRTRASRTRRHARLGSGSSKCRTTHEIATGLGSCAAEAERRTGTNLLARPLPRFQAGT